MNTELISKKMYAVILLALISFGCNTNGINKYEIKFSENKKIGSIDVPEDEIIGTIDDFCFDKEGNLFVLDNGFKMIKMYDPEGSFIQNFSLIEGKGPGEVMKANSINTDLKGNLYITDIIKRTIMIFNKELELKKEISLRIVPAQIEVENDDILYLLGFPFSYTGNLVKKINISKNTYNVVSELVVRDSSKHARNVELSGYAGYMLYNHELNNFYYTHFFPYKILKFDSIDSVIAEYTPEEGKLNPPVFDEKNKYVEPIDGSKRLFIVNDHILCNVYFKKSDDKEKYYFDFFEESDLSLVASYSQNEIEINYKPNKINRGPNGDVYISTNEDYPRIISYAVSIKEIGN